MVILPPRKTAVGTREEAECLPDGTILAFVRRELRKPERRRVEEHMARCSECREVVSHVAKLELAVL